MQRQRAFTLIELLVVMGIIAILASLLLGALVSAQHRSRQASCLNNLHQLGIGFTGFALDHDGSYPMRLSARFDGSMEYRSIDRITNTTFSANAHHFLALSNQVPNPRVMTCPADRRKRAPNFASFGSENLSYWANTEAVPHGTLSTLAGDRNLTAAKTADAEHPVLQFDKRTHRYKGSVLFADGRVEITRQVAYTPAAKPNPVGGRIPPKIVAPPNRTVEAPLSPPPAVVAPRQNPQPTQNASSEQGRDAIPNQRTSQNSQTNPPPSPASARSAEWNPRKNQSASPAASPDSGAASRASAIATDASRAGPADKNDSLEDSWNTPRFRIIKMLVAAGYLLALIWAIILLLLCYLRWRIEQRRKARENSAAQN